MGVAIEQNKINPASKCLDSRSRRWNRRKARLLRSESNRVLSKAEGIK
jgi:hypothetical protein